MLKRVLFNRARSDGERKRARVVVGSLLVSGAMAGVLVGASHLASSGASAARSSSSATARRPVVPETDGLGLGSASLSVSRGGCGSQAGFGKPFIRSVWPGGFKGVAIYSNGVSGSFHDCLHRTETPAHRLVVDGYEWQCVELVDRLYLKKGWISSPWLGNGDQMYSTAPGRFHKQRQGHIRDVSPGDVISFLGPPGNPYGHAAVIGRVKGNTVTIMNQNTNRASVLSHAHLVGGRIVMVGWAGWRPIGVIDHP